MKTPQSKTDEAFLDSWETQAREFSKQLDIPIEAVRGIMRLALVSIADAAGTDTTKYCRLFGIK
ncbi:MAG: hypothetical protein WA705_29680 [Candidatus Ozemobacteraceae bacterium]